MSHIAKVGRSSWRVRTGLGALYFVLILGALTTVYPFLLMVSTAMKSQVDYNEFTPRTLLPPYLRDDSTLFVKYVEDRYAGNLDTINAAHNTDYVSPATVTPPVGSDTSGTKALIADWSAFSATLSSDTFKSAGFGEHDAAPSRLLILYRAHLAQHFNGDIYALNEAWTEENTNPPGFGGVTPPFERTKLREWVPDATPKAKDWQAFKATLPASFQVVTTADPIYRTYLRQNIYEDSLPKLNAAWGASFTDWNQITLARTLPSGKERGDWESFLRTKFPLRMLGIQTEQALPAWRAFLTRRGRADARTARIPATVPDAGPVRTDWMEFIAREIPLAALSADSPENRWRQALGANYKTVAAANTAFGTNWKTWGDAQPPQAAADWNYTRANAASLRSEFATRNFRWVFTYITANGRAALNTVLFCVLAVLGAVIINPLCAYALSRYPLPYTYKVLLFLLATMAFPAEVAMIPNFLLLRDLHLLNTFWALILPGVASGFSIFLLKGFFDSLPKELYEAGILDGATEVGMFRRITIPLSMPIFSVIALNAFTAAYGAFLFALVVCQDQKMWTLMVYLYNLQGSAPQYVIMAALTLAALPTLVVFLLAQKIILRGIILPSFK
ncbi:MAG: carbohydrate ABC transporter permease [Cytophagales bacterium]|nr:carbohydrate ABC transporter permease [Armatimonadota bacterium]